VHQRVWEINAAQFLILRNGPEEGGTCDMGLIYTSWFVQISLIIP